MFPGLTDCVFVRLRVRREIAAMASGRFMEEMMREHEQSLLESACGGLFDHIDDLLDFPKDDCAADVLLLDAPVPGSPLAARVLDACGLPPVKPEQPAFLALPPPPPTQSAAGVEESAFMAALGDGHVGSVSFSPPIFTAVCFAVGSVRRRACLRLGGCDGLRAPARTAEFKET
jgi:hypothetical protein